FQSLSSVGVGVSGTGSVNGVVGTGLVSGVYGTSTDPSGRGVFGLTSSATGGTNGVRGESVSPDGRGVLGFGSATSGLNYGVRGQSNSASGFGVYSVGASGASGTKSFRIDHPDDPENKYLLHYSSESPMPQNFYVGNVVTDSRGYGWVDLPSYFEEINTNFKYQLTVVDGKNSDDFVAAKVGLKIKEGF
ncbi:MAG: hypothetical protein ABL962_13155, partial [Fimbriimonadaceae bacterium]